MTPPRCGVTGSRRFCSTSTFARPSSSTATGGSAGSKGQNAHGMMFALAAPYAVLGHGALVGPRGGSSASYDTATSVLTVVAQSTVVTYLDPANDRLGLVTPGQPLPVLSNSYAAVLY